MEILNIFRNPSTWLNCVWPVLPFSWFHLCETIHCVQCRPSHDYRVCGDACLESGSLVSGAFISGNINISLMVIHTIFTSPQYVLKLSQTDDGIRDAPPSWIFQFLLLALQPTLRISHETLQKIYNGSASLWKLLHLFSLAALGLVFRDVNFRILYLLYFSILYDLIKT